jgi:hypothetical protein
MKKLLFIALLALPCCEKPADDPQAPDEIIIEDTSSISVDTAVPDTSPADTAAPNKDASEPKDSAKAPDTSTP